ncbi:hypothetical protein CsSME_00032968 [Camellia sinensis var. sinensis]
MIEEAMRTEGVNFVTIKPLGGVKVLLQFNTVEDMKEMLQGSRWWLKLGLMKYMSGIVESLSFQGEFGWPLKGFL